MSEQTSRSSSPVEASDPEAAKPVFAPYNPPAGGLGRPWITAKGGIDYLRATVKEIFRAAKLHDDLSFASSRHGGFTEAADADLTDAQLRAAGRHQSAKQLPTYTKRTRKQLIDVVQNRSPPASTPADPKRSSSPVGAHWIARVLRRKKARRRISLRGGEGALCDQGRRCRRT